MTYDKIAKIRVSATNQHCLFAFKERVTQFKSYFKIDQTVWHFKNPSLSLYSRSVEEQSNSSDPRSEKSIYGKIIRADHISSQGFCEIQRSIYKRNSRTSPCGFCRETKAWAEKIQNLKFVCISVLTGWLTKSYAKPIGFSSLMIT